MERVERRGNIRRPVTVSMLAATALFGLAGSSGPDCQPGRDGAVACYDSNEGERVLSVTSQLDDQAELVEYLSQHYDTPIGLVAEDKTVGSLSIMPVEAESTTEDLHYLADALSMLPAELVAQLDISSISLAGEMQRTDSRPDPSGIYFSSQNEIYIDADRRKDWRGVVVHEIMHAIDYQILRTADTKHNDQLYLESSKDLYGKNTEDNNQIKSRHIKPNPDRKFVSTYGATSINEDRATMLAYTFYERGIIQQNDPDWDSPFHQKQQLLLAQLETLAPGTIAYLESRTPLLRENSDELLSSVPNDNKPGEFSTPRAIIAQAYINDRPVEQLVGTEFMMVNTCGHVDSVVNPVVVRDNDGDIAGFAWTNPSSEIGLKVEHAYYDPALVAVKKSPGAYSNFGLVESTSPNRDEGFVDGGLRVNGVWASASQ